MEKSKTVLINGRHYDVQTGLPVAAPAKTATATKHARPAAATSVHASAPQRSETLNRRAVKKYAPAKPAPKPPRSTAAASVHSSVTQKSEALHRMKHPVAGRTMDIARSSKVTKFAPATPAPKPTVVEKDHPPIPHPMATRALKRHEKPAKKSISKPTAAAVKQAAISKALSKPAPSREPHKKLGFWARHRRLWVLIGIIVIILGVGGYTAFVNLPGISVSFAAQQAGIKATYPGYIPDGYHLQQPVTFSDGQVTLNFASNGGGKGYTITQTRSSWDSSAVLENVVQKSAGSNYITTQDSGLTIYNYGSNAAWVNNGLLYQITTQAPLSNEQVRNIATSL